MSGIIYYWRAGSSYRQADETFSRSGTRYAFNHKTGLYEEVADGVPRTSSWVHATDGEWYRTRELALGDTPVTDDSARFEAANTAWSLQGGGTPTDDGTKTSIFDTLPTNGEARQLSASGGSGDDAIVVQSAGSSTGSREAMSAIFEQVDSDLSIVRVTDDTGQYINSRYDWTTDTHSTSAGAGYAVVLDDSGPNGGKVVLVVGTAAGNNTTGRTVQASPVIDTANGSAIVHYAAHHETGFFPGPDPQAGTASAIPGESFDVDPGPYRSGVVQAFYLEFIAGTRVGDTGAFPVAVAHGDGTNPLIRVFERDSIEGTYQVVYNDADGNAASGVRADIGSADAHQRVELVYAFNPADGQARLIGRADGGTVDSDADTPGSWTTPTALGSNNRIVYNELGDLSGSRRGRNFFRRHLGILGPDLDADPLTGGASAVMDEMAALATLND